MSAVSHVLDISGNNDDDKKKTVPASFLTVVQKDHAEMEQDVVGNNFTR